MGHIGDVNADFHVSVLFVLQRKSVVKVFGVNGVNGKGSDRSHISPAGNFTRRDGRRNSLSLLLYIVRKVVGKSVFGQNGVHFGLVVARFTQYFDDLALGFARAAGPLRDLYNDLIAIVGVFEVVQLNVDGVIHFTMAGFDQGVLGPNFYHTDHFGAAMGNDFQNPPFEALPAGPTIAEYLYPNSIAVDGSFQEVSFYVNIVVLVFHDHKRKVAVHVVDPAHDAGFDAICYDPKGAVGVAKYFLFVDEFVNNFVH